MRIDVKHIIQNKKPKIYKYIPRFFFGIVSKLIHQNEINEVLEKYGDLKDIAFVTATLDDLDIRREYIGIDRIDPKGRYILAANHPLGGVDGMAIAEAVARRNANVKIVVNDVLMNLTPIKGIFIPINKYGRQNPDYARNLTEILEGDDPVIYFPAGLCSRRVKGVVTDSEWKKNFINKALETSRDIIPVYVDEVNSPLFYGLSNFRKALGIKLNIEMLLLPSELFKRRGKRIRILFGEPIPFERLTNGEKSPEEWTEIVRAACYKLSETK